MEMPTTLKTELHLDPASIGLLRVTETFFACVEDQ